MDLKSDVKMSNALKILHSQSQDQLKEHVNLELDKKEIKSEIMEDQKDSLYHHIKDANKDDEAMEFDQI